MDHTSSNLCNLEKAIDSAVSTCIGDRESLITMRIMGQSDSSSQLVDCERHDGATPSKILADLTKECDRMVTEGRGYSVGADDSAMAICVTVTCDCRAQANIYVAFCKDAVDNDGLIRRVVSTIDDHVANLGLNWNIGGALPKGYEPHHESYCP